MVGVMDDQEVLLIPQVARVLGKTELAIRMMVYRGHLPVRRMGRRIVFLRQEIEEYVRNLPTSE
jgi:excisionase family DNA binding protein